MAATSLVVVCLMSRTEAAISEVPGEYEDGKSHQPSGVEEVELTMPPDDESREVKDISMTDWGRREGSRQPGLKKEIP